MLAIRRFLPLRLLSLAPLLTLFLIGCASRGDRSDDEIPPHIARIPDAVPKVEPLSRSGNPESYVVLGKRYYTQRDRRGYVERGLASWYGQPFHGRPTSSGETYDMHAMSAAHKTLPLPTYARVTNLENGRSIVIRINDRGPFKDERIIDLSHTAAVKLGVVRTGTARVEVRAIEPSRRGADASPFLASHADGGSNQRRLASRPTTLTASRPPSAPATPTRIREATSVTPSPPIAAGVAPRSQVPVQGTPLYLQVGAFGDPGNAERLRARLTTHLLHEQIRILDPDTSGAVLYQVRIGPLASEHEAERLAEQITALGVERPLRVWN
ncbi:septal ring lytic transglycosylase RlpA family protein [Thiobaca trueperi]|uniref:Endolytic peptidoglycan transglycosylase RlpA n=1 Tax=Thiobaca trueperi TaxID=127458 RepID=A0A4R3MZP7_9GAMM|nr:septal ring lytic transglycosylase RlpA family protein [Thiobaca trueperi]TCT22200.1 rare lipoprotein A [Thiobaca trueperi]